MRDGIVVRTGRGSRSTRNTGKRRSHEGTQWLQGLAALALRNPGAVFGGMIFAAALTAVSVNALTLQNAPHPAPLFSGGAAQEGARVQAPLPAMRPAAAQPPVNAASRVPAPAARTAPTPIAPVAPASREAGAPRSIDELLAAPVPPTRPGSSESGASSVVPRGSIAALLADVDGPTRTGSTGPTGPDAVIASAQRALEALGYGPLTADGLYGPMTREAIERFESDHGLAVTGQLVPATAQLLARESGIAFE